MIPSIVIFDFDDTLVISEQIKKQNYFIATSHIDGSDKILTEIFRNGQVNSRYDVFSSLAKILSLNEKEIMEEIGDEYSRLCIEKITKAGLVPGTHEILQTLKLAGVKLFISSATPTIELRSIMKVMKLDLWFNAIYGLPQKKILHLMKIMAATGSLPNELVFIGDSDSDKKVAFDFGCHFIGFSHETNKFENLPEYHVTSLKEITSRIADI